jgi:hypothetical protein
MLDGKRYYAVFPDEDPELRPRIRAVLDAQANLDKAFRQHLEAFRPENLHSEQKTTRSNGNVTWDSLPKQCFYCIAGLGAFIRSG